MSFRINESQQVSLFDRTNNLTDRERKYLNKSWAKEFAEYIFPTIDEKPFRVLYCEDNGRPNTPVNVIIGALILKEMNNLTDEELLESILLDPRYQHALHLTSYDEIPVSDRSFSRLREKLYWHEVITGEDLLKDVVQDYSKAWSKRMKVNGKLKRMDSLMVSTSSKNMGRLELIFTCTSNLVKLHIENDGGKLLPQHLLQYNSENKNSYCYRLEKDEVITKLEEVTADAILVYGLSELFSTTTQYIQMTRLLEEQTIDGRLKDKNQVSTTSMQNPSDEDATFRTKAGKDYKGYTLNIVEDCSEDINLITQYDYEANVHSDMDFAAELIEELGYQEEEVKVLADGAYASKENFDTAKENNIELITTNLVGKKTPEIIADFKVEDDMIIECPEGHKPTDCKYKEKYETYRAHFDKETCKSYGLKIVDLEVDNKLQDAVLSVHHAYMATLANSSAIKIIENHMNKAYITQQNLPPKA